MFILMPTIDLPNLSLSILNTVAKIGETNSRISRLEAALASVNAALTFFYTHDGRFNGLGDEDGNKDGHQIGGGGLTIFDSDNEQGVRSVAVALQQDIGINRTELSRLNDNLSEFKKLVKQPYENAKAA